MYKVILFDVDGVLLSEERYFDASALTVWELLHSPQYLHLSGDSFSPNPDENVIRRVRERVFSNDDVLRFIKSRGLNSNWDMVYLVFSYQWIRLLEILRRESVDQVRRLLDHENPREALSQTAALVGRTGYVSPFPFEEFVTDFAAGTAWKSEMLTDLNRIASERLKLEVSVFSGTHPLWTLCQETFQEWYLGDELVADSIGRPTAQPGKRGFLEDEIPIVEPERMRNLFQQLRNRGITLGIGTGRPLIETMVPLQSLGLLEWFDGNRIVTATHVLDAETAFPDLGPLSKPHPYSYVQGLLGDVPAEVCLKAQLPVENGDEVLIVGDSLADLLAARAMGCRFAATLTGLSGEEARETFEREKADYILRDVTELMSIFQ